LTCSTNKSIPEVEDEDSSSANETNDPIYGDSKGNPEQLQVPAPISSMDKMIVTIGSPDHTNVYSGRLLIEVAGEAYQTGSGQQKSRKATAKGQGSVGPKNPQNTYSNSYEVDTLERGLSSDFPDDSLERPQHRSKQKRQKNSPSRSGVGYPNSSNNNSPMSVAASQASSVLNVAAPDEDELTQSKKDYSFRLFENGQLVGSAAEGASATSAQNSLTTTTSGGGSSITTTTSDEPISSCISSPLSSLPPALPPKKSKHPLNSPESIYENNDVLTDDAESAVALGSGSSSRGKRSIAERKQYFEALSASQENVSKVMDMNVLKTNNNNNEGDYYLEDDSSVEGNRRVWQRNCV